MTRKSTQNFLRFFDTLVNGNEATANEFIQRQVNRERRNTASVILDTLGSARDLEDSLGPFGTQDDVWGPGGVLDQRLAQLREQDKIKEKAWKEKNKEKWEKERLESEAECRRSFWGVLAYGKTDKELIEMEERMKKERESWR